MRAFFLLPILATACSQQAAITNNAADIHAAADEAQDDIDNYAAADAAIERLNPAAPGQPGGLADDKTPISETPLTPESPQGAAKVVQTYYALIGEGKYAEAWKLWGNGGQASGQSVDAFAASFAKYTEYRANVGAPGREDAGAGQRYVTVPVQPYARLKDGKAAYWIGSVVLHRTGDIDGATAEDQAWRIKSIDLKPAPPGAK
ncbi:MAG: hypothetical protein J0J06_01060 [Sphingomonas sp.]|uniref:hypothetical protein n=1 Tax=Sphingomonas sp. TaxID=28214 RepID=UPI001AC3FD29|nr:hypothetical protein [Sphingomonas sp.]MBN8814017.1 hypothetical protein [Sphingomonas sp.]